MNVESLRLTTSVMRSELQRLHGDGESRGTSWKLQLAHTDVGGALVGTLRVETSQASAQVLTITLIERLEEGRERIPVDDITRWARAVCEESAYDTARRTMAAHAALLDLDLDLPLMPPATELERLTKP